MTLASRARSMSCRADSGTPHTTDWCGQLSCDTPMSARPAHSSAASSAPQPSATKAASAKSSCPGRISATKSSTASTGIMPVTICAVHSPRLCPATTSGRAPTRESAASRMRPTATMPRPCISSARGIVAARRAPAGRRRRPRRRHAGRTTAPPRGTRTPPDLRRWPGPRARTTRRCDRGRACRARGPCGPARGAWAWAPRWRAGRGPSPAPAATPRSRRWRRTRRVDGPARPRRLPASSSTGSPAGRRGRDRCARSVGARPRCAVAPAARSVAPWASSTTCALMPPKPKALTAAREAGRSVPGLGFGARGGTASPAEPRVRLLARGAWAAARRGAARARP